MTYSSKGYKLQNNPFIVPADGGKLIEEHFGIASINCGDFSVAHMIAPPGWSEPFQTPEFDEITYIISGKKQFEINGEKIVLNKNQSICVCKGSRIKYSNPFDEPVEYLSFCIPAFSVERLKREEC
jgi:mannose-6-phosphate isomerase-like protein (cupin superfamily)